MYFENFIKIDKLGLVNLRTTLFQKKEFKRKSKQ